MEATKLDRFTLAYIEAALWSSSDNSDESGGEPLDRNYGIANIAPDTMAEIIADCAKFQSDNADLLARYYEELPRTEWSPEEQAGHDFWLSRNGHGAGFFDRDCPDEIKDALQGKARECGEVDLYIGDDGRVWA